MEQLRVNGAWFVDDRGRHRLLRGVNFGANAKLPRTPPGWTHLAPDAAGHRDVSFVGQPVSADDADAWFARLRAWGCDVVRFPVTWEAIEHAGPGIHDEAYLDHVRACIAAAGRHGIHVIIDPHQDAWSRWTGGDGAPGWTLEAAGFALGALGRSGAAILDWERRGTVHDVPMVWPNSRARAGSATMFSLFLAGARVLPTLHIDGRSADDALQGRFVAAIAAIAERVADLPNVLGYEALNEPSGGWLGIPDMAAALPVYGIAPRLSILDALAVASGIAVRAPVVDARSGPPVIVGETVLNRDGTVAWIDGRCPWREAGLWDVDAAGLPVALRPYHFAAVSSWDDGMRPFLRRFAAAVRTKHPGALLFVEAEPEAEDTATWSEADGDPGGIVAAPHWYDLATLVEKRWDPERCIVWGRPGVVVRGRDAVRASFAEQVASLARSATAFGDVPVIVGEIGVPFDLEPSAPGGGAEPAAEAALHAYADALDAALVSATWWNVTPDNDADRGDGWNGEDLSLVTHDPAAPDTPRPRALGGWSRPRLIAVAGRPVAVSFDVPNGTLTVEVEAADCEGAPTVMHLPAHHVGSGGPCPTASAGRTEFDPASGVLRWWHPATGRHVLVVEMASRVARPTPAT